MKNIKIIDNHCHIFFPEKIDTTVQQTECMVNELGLEKIAILSYPHVHFPEQEWDILENLKALYVKDCLNIPVYAYAGFTHYSSDARKNADFMRNMMEMGFDGWKSAEMHPRLHKQLGYGLNHSSFAATFDYIQEQGVPIVCHLGDPITHWDINKVTKWERENDRFYDATYPSLEQLYDEMEEVLQKYPKLKIALAHFYFVSDDYDRAVHMMEAYENVYMDLTPGREMFVNFSKDPKRWREFFIRFSKKIIMGSDLYSAGYGVNRHELVRMFLEEDKPFKLDSWENTFLPFNLPQEVLEDIYVGNAERISSETPKPVNRKKAYEYCKDIAENYWDELNDIGKENLEVFLKFWGDS